MSTKDFVKILSSEHETTLHDFNENRLFLGKLKILEGGLYEDGCGSAIFSIPFKYELLEEGEDPSVYCTKLTDLMGKEHVILIIKKDVLINIEDGSRLITYKYKDKTLFFGKDKLKRSEYDITCTKTVGIDCMTGESFIMDSKLFESLGAKVISFNEVNALDLVNNISKTYYIGDGEDDVLTNQLKEFLSITRDVCNKGYIDFIPDSRNKSFNRNLRMKIDYLPIVLKKGKTFYVDIYIEGRKKGGCYIEVDSSCESGLIKCKTEDGDCYYLY